MSIKLYIKWKFVFDSGMKNTQKTHTSQTSLVISAGISSGCPAYRWRASWMGPPWPAWQSPAAGWRTRAPMTSGPRESTSSSRAGRCPPANPRSERSALLRPKVSLFFMCVCVCAHPCIRANPSLHKHRVCELVVFAWREKWHFIVWELRQDMPCWCQREYGSRVGVCAYIDNNLYVIYVDERRAIFIHAIDMRMSVMCIQPCTSLLWGCLCLPKIGLQSGGWVGPLS